MCETGFFRETLGPPIWAEALTLGLITGMSGLLLYQHFTGVMVWQNPAPNQVYAALVVLLSFIYATFRRLEITVDAEGVTLSYWWIRRVVPFSDVSSVELTKITPSEYSGLGLRYSTRGGEAFSNRFGDAVRLNRKNDEPVVFTPENSRRTLGIINEFKKEQ
jgi:hypothetical protein